MHRAGNITARVKSDRKALGPNNIDLRQVGFLMKPSRRFLTLITKIHRQQMLYCVVVIRYRTIFGVDVTLILQFKGGRKGAGPARGWGGGGSAETWRTREHKKDARVQERSEREEDEPFQAEYYSWKGHFRVPITLTSNRGRVQNLSCEDEFYLHENKKIIFVTMVLHKGSLWNRGMGHLGNRLRTSHS